MYRQTSPPYLDMIDCVSVCRSVFVVVVVVKNTYKVKKRKYQKNEINTAAMVYLLNVFVIKETTRFHCDKHA